MRSAAVALSLLLSLTGVAQAQELDRPAFGERTNSLENSVPSGTAVPGVLSLGLREAVDRAVKNNLAAILGTQVLATPDEQSSGETKCIYKPVSGNFKVTSAPPPR